MSETMESEADADNSVLEPIMPSEVFSGRIKRFSSLGSEMTKLLSELSKDMQESLDQLQRIRSEINLKKEELKTLHDIEVSAISLGQLIEDHRLQKENLEYLIESQRKVWEEERARRAQEEREYLENLKRQRQREEEEYKHARALKESEGRKKLEEELRGIRQKGLEDQQALESDCLERERTLKEKELEWIQLVQELEQFMSRLIQRTRSQAAVRADLHKIESPNKPDFSVPMASVHGGGNASQPAFGPEGSQISEKISEEP
jgi:hypothetical protein